MMDVVKKYNNRITYEENWIMGENSQGKSFLQKASEHPIISSVLAAFIIAIGSLIFNGYISVKLMDYRLQTLETNMQTNFASLQSSIDRVQGDVDTLSSDFETFKSETNQSINSIKHDLGVLEGKISVIENGQVLAAAYIKPSGGLANAIITNYQNYDAVHASENKKVYSGFEKYVATDVVTGNEYTLPDLENRPIIMAYEENGETVFFKGQFDENGYWNGNCIINRYNGEQLTMIMDAVYESGALISYEQVFPYTTLADNDVWVVSKRKVEEADARSGETWMYFRNDEYIKNFDSSEISDTDFVTTQDFMLSMSLQIEGYYNGYTSEGKYNDNSKDAYLVKYKENGDVRYLYVGAIRDGVPNDDSGSAWALSWGYADDGYYYYKGVFYNGTHDMPPNWKPATQEEIDTVLNPDDFNCSLQGLVSIDV